MSLSTVHKGGAFEKRALRLLQSSLSMSLQRVGGRSDGGIDLQGWWWLPSQSPDRKRIRVLAQCKAEKKKIGPKYIREMEGVLHRFSSPAVALFISESQFSRETLLRAHSSSIPFFLLHLPPDDNQDQGIGSIVWNPALSGTDGILGGHTEARWEHSVEGHPGRLGLWVDGKRLPNWTPGDQGRHLARRST